MSNAEGYFIQRRERNEFFTGSRVANDKHRGHFLMENNNSQPAPQELRNEQPVYQAQLIPPQNCMQSNIDITEKQKKWISKITIIVTALIIFQIPLYLIKDLANERQKNFRQVQQEFAQSWGGEKTISISDAENFSATAELIPEVRYRGIYQVPVYTANVKISAGYEKDKDSVCKIMTGDLKGIQNADISVNGKPVKLNKNDDSLSFPLPEGKSQCEITLKLRGCGNFKILPSGISNKIEISGSWDSPAFIGDILPETRSINANGFTAMWNIGEFNSENSETGVNLHVAAGTYQQLERTFSYATFFLIVFFFTLLAGELISKVDIHPLQYLIAAGAPVLFYLMVLAISEQLGFTAGFLISAAVIVVMVTMYARMFMNKLLPAVLMGIVFAASYLLNFQLLRMEELALLTGTIVLAVILGVLMLLTGKINRKAPKENA